MSDRRVGRNDPCPCGSGRKIKHCCLSRSNGAAAAFGEFTDQPSPQAAPLRLNQKVKVFRRETRTWADTLLKEIPPGQEFIAFNRLHKVLAPEVYAENPTLDVSRISEADRPFDRNNYRSPASQDVVYVFDEEDPDWGHWQFSNLHPGQRCVFQGRVYAIEPGPDPNTCTLIGLNQIFSERFLHLAERQKAMFKNIVVGKTFVTSAFMPAQQDLEGTLSPPTAEEYWARYEAIQNGVPSRPTEVVLHYTYPEPFGYAQVEIVVPADKFFCLPNGRSVNVRDLEPGQEISLKGGTVGKITLRELHYGIPDAHHPVESGLWAGRVIGRVKHTAFEILEWRLAGQVIEGTPDHLVWSVSRKGWIRACELIPGELVRPAGHFVLPVESVGPRRTGFIEVYGIEVEFFHNYFVGSGDSAMLVHNGPQCLKTPEEAEISASAARRIQNAANRYRVAIHVVGSRAKGKAAQNALSDWDYIVQGSNSRIRGKLKKSLPRGIGGGDLGGHYPSGMDLMHGDNPLAPGYNPLDPTLPHVTFSPQ
ncbi:MAG TPA: SEC-C metal-binding domain-containing protein [Gemmataceae bacterium]|nr:SEC-C metal-binding domain-containing protein [Gemmataceae bacterium]